MPRKCCFGHLRIDYNGILLHAPSIRKRHETTMPQESMTPKERWLAVLQGKTPDRVPMDYWGTDETTAMLMRHLECDEPWDLFRKLHIDRVCTVKPEYVGPPIPDDYDVFGCGFRDVSYGLGFYRECVFHPLAQYATLEELKANLQHRDRIDSTREDSPLTRVPDAIEIDTTHITLEEQIQLICDKAMALIKQAD